MYINTRLKEFAFNHSKKINKYLQVPPKDGPDPITVRILLVTIDNRILYINNIPDIGAYSPELRACFEQSATRYYCFKIIN